MMVIRPRLQKVMTDLWGNVTRSILVVASIAVGLIAIGIITTIYVVVSNDIRAGYRAVSPTNINIQTGLINNDVITHVSHIEGVNQAEGVRSLSLRILNKDNQWQNVEIRAYEHVDLLTINKLRLVEGRWPQKGEMVFDMNRLGEINAGIGDEVTIELPSKKERKFLLVGIVQDQTIGAYGNSGGFFTAPVQAYIHQDTLEYLEQSSTSLFNGMYVTVSGIGNDLDQIQVVADRINHDLKFANIGVTSTKVVSSWSHPNAALVDAIASILIVLGFLSVFLSGTLVTNTLQALLKQQTQQIGIMKSIGARQLQISIVYLALILVFGIIAFLIAVPVSYFAAYQLIKFVAGKINFVLLGQRLEVGIVILQAGLALLMPVASAWKPIWDGSKISVIEALNPGLHSRHKKKSAPRAKGKKFVLFSQLSKAPLHQTIAFRNTFRQTGRLVLTLITLSLGGAIFIATFNVRASVDQYIAQIRQYFMADVSLSLKRPYRYQEIGKILDHIDEIGYYEGWSGTMARIIRDDGTYVDRVSIVAPPTDSRVINPVIISGRWMQAEDQNDIVLGDAFSLHYPEIKLGDTIRLRIDDKDSEWKVVGFFQFAGKESGLIAYTNYRYLANLTNSYDQVSTIQINGKKKMSENELDQLKRRIESEMDKEDIKVSNLSISIADSSSSSGGLTTLTIFLLFMAILIAIVGSIGLAGTMSMNVMERTREIGILRAIGASDQTLMQMVLFEGLTIGIISYLIGIILSFPITTVLGDSVIMAIFGTSATIAYTPTGFIIWFLVVVILSSIASVIPARSAAQLTIREVLSYE